MGLLIFVVVLPVLAVILGVRVAGACYRLIRLQDLVQESWRQIDFELTCRHEIVPDLVEAVRAQAGHERQVLESVLDAHSAALSGGGSTAGRAAAESAFSLALDRMLAVAQAYPGIRGDESFLALRAELAGNADRVAAGQRLYNMSALRLNARIRSFPMNLVASVLKVPPADRFEVTWATLPEAGRVPVGEA